MVLLDQKYQNLFLYPTSILFFFQAEDGIRDSVASRGLGDVYKRQKLDSNLRIGPCVSKPSKFIGIGLNFKDHAQEQNLPIPKEPIIFSKFTSCITGPNDPIIVPKGSEHTDLSLIHI